MATVRVGCRASSAMFGRPVACRADMLNPRCWSGNFSSKSWWGTGACNQRLWCQILGGAGFERKGSAVRSWQHRFFVKAIDVSGPGAIDSPLMQSMQSKIKEDLNAESVTVKDAYGDGRHVSIDVVASVFEGKSAVNRQRLVYKAIWQELQETVHAVDQLKTRTPSEVASSLD